MRTMRDYAEASSVHGVGYFKLTAEVGGYLGLWLGFSMLDMYGLIVAQFMKL